LQQVFLEDTAGEYLKAGLRAGTAEYTNNIGQLWM